MSNRMHLIAPAGTCRAFLQTLHRVSQPSLGQGRTSHSAVAAISPKTLIDLIQGMVGETYRVTGNESLIDVEEHELDGGRHDDRERAQDLQEALADDNTRVIVALRGGAWFTRILPRIDFSVLERRTRPVAVFGFSELTTLVNIVAGSPQGRGVYDMGPAFLSYGLKRYAELVLRLPTESTAHPSAAEWADRLFLPEMRAYFQDVISMAEGRGSGRRIEAERVAGQVPEKEQAEFVGGNLCVISTLLGSDFGHAIDTTDRWLVIEDLNEKPERIDRFLAHLTLAGAWRGCRGILLGDFHRREEALTSAVAAMLKYHLPQDHRMPVLTTRQVGHIWPMAPLPLRIPITIRRTDDLRYVLEWPASAVAVGG